MKNLLGLIAIMIMTNVAAYLYLRYTKNVYEAESVLKLDIKEDATALGFTSIVENQNVNNLSGEIEQIKSKLFFNRVIDSMQIGISYYAIGQVLDNELYSISPFMVELTSRQHSYFNRPVYLTFTGINQFNLRIEDQQLSGKFEQILKLDDLELIIHKTKFFPENTESAFYFIIHSRTNLLNYLQTKTEVLPLNFDAHTIRISFRDHNAQKASDIVNKIDSVYLSYSNEQKNLTNKQKIDWLNDELMQIEDKMESYENYFENFTLQNKSNNLSKDLERTISTLYSIDSQRFQLNRKLNDLNVIVDQFSSNNFSISLTHRISLPGYLNKNLEELQRLVNDRDKLSLSYNENTFAYQQKEKELVTLRNQALEQLNEVRKEWIKNMIDLNTQKQQLEKSFASMPDKSTQFAKNQRHYKLYEEFYLSMMQSKAGFEIAKAGSTPDFKILSAATVPLAPISPKRMIIFLLGFSSGFILNILFLALLYLVDHRVTSLQELERLTDIPVLGVIPESRLASKTPFHVLDNPKSIISEGIRTLRTNLDFFSFGGRSKTISISSTVAGEGKSFLALNLGGVIAMSRKKVLLVDLDMRKLKYQTPFAIPDAQKGISTALIGKYSIEDCIIPTGLDNFDYIPSGPHPPNPSELLTNGDFTDILEKLKALYEFVILDTPPVGLVTDGIMAMKKTDISIYVIRANYSKKEFLQNASRIQQLHKLKNLSIVFNALPVDKRMYRYGYYEDQTAMKKRWQNFFRR